MRTMLSQVMTDACREDPNRIILSGDHGYALFDQVRKSTPDSFVNVGISEQAMIGYAAGLVRAGYKPIVYGLAAFVPMRVLEQIKLDLCHANLPVILLGDGAGLVYSTLGNSHQCAEDIACLRPLPNLRI
jgi:transketolase